MSTNLGEQQDWPAVHVAEMKTISRREAIAMLLVFIVVNTALVSCFRPVLAGSYMFILALILAIPCFVFLFIFVLAITGRLSMAFAWAGLPILTAFVAPAISQFVVYEDLLEAKSYCEELLPLLDQHFAQSGEYPPDLTRIDSRRPPLLLRDLPLPFYGSQGHKFSFLIHDPVNPFDAYIFISDRREWEHVHR